MERPNHLNTAVNDKASKLTGVLIVIALHIGVVIALIVGLAQGQILKQIQEIKASVESEKVPPKAPPPPPPDLAKPPPPVAIVPEFSVQQEAPPPITTVKQAPPAPPPPKAVTFTATSLKAIARTHTTPPYPTIALRLGEQGTTNMEVAISTEGAVTSCKVTKGSGSDRLDAAACSYVQGHWRWEPPKGTDGNPMTANTDVSVIWDLKDAH
jgi:protein TonB